MNLSTYSDKGCCHCVSKITTSDRRLTGSDH